MSHPRATVRAEIMRVATEYFDATGRLPTIRGLVSKSRVKATFAIARALAQLERLGYLYRPGGKGSDWNLEGNVVTPAGRAFLALTRDMADVPKQARAPRGVPNIKDLSRTVFVDRVKLPDAEPLQAGDHNAKIGGLVLKGKWAGLRIFYLTLEERATCPQDCAQLARCYGNNMPFARRNMHGYALESAIVRQLAQLIAKYPKGILVRLHALGDFYSASYVQFWISLMELFPTLHVFGYTAWKRGTPIGEAVFTANVMLGDRFVVRFSGNGDETKVNPRISATVADAVPSRNWFMCPEQTGKVQSCGACAACWQSPKGVVFRPH